MTVGPSSAESVVRRDTLQGGALPIATARKLLTSGAVSRASEGEPIKAQHPNTDISTFSAFQPCVSYFAEITLNRVNICNEGVLGGGRFYIGVLLCGCRDATEITTTRKTELLLRTCALRWSWTGENCQKW